ncbi:alkaline phosphatase D family protein [Aeoliella mucimassa]|uniref:PhoD-like phosphatase n=1 Tax=Aeoliella mucimassa TaxID=2527972 RepID=A0A518AUQ1_9BACT|nr:metallophosphoesterase family protein [Aeoliella mucimassa]QDU58446.1 PhoD-like phosphatase [Aeoliella mucimassa]
MSSRLVWLALLAVVVAFASPNTQAADDAIGPPPVVAPFKKLDTVCVNDWWNREASPIIDVKVPRDQVVAFGVYTVSEGTLKLTAQLYPLYPNESRTVRLELDRGNGWEQVAEAPVHDLGWSAHFRVDDWDESQAVAYRLSHGEKASFTGLVRANPVDQREIKVAVLSCNSNRDRGMRPNFVRNLKHQDPDLLFFAGDQSYDHREHTAAWLKFGLQFRDVLRDRPCVTIPDDHDIGQPNLWGENGKVSTLSGASDGGYTYHPEYVKMVERCQTWHLPDPVDPAPIEQGIGVYFTRLHYAGLDFAILEDRKFKSGPAGKIPQQGPRPDHITTPDYDPSSLDVAGLKLLGDRQLKFLEEWATDRTPGEQKVVLSQTVFCGGPHLHGSKNNRLYCDLDSNGWPQTGRNAAVRLIGKSGAVHLAGDQHIAMLLEYGADEYRDGGWAFASPAIVNTIYGRWWAPVDGQPGGNPDVDSPLELTGDYLDGFGNKITMHAYANAEPGDRAEGYGLVRFDKQASTATFECWPREADVTKPDAEQFKGWPRTVELQKPGS